MAQKLNSKTLAAHIALNFAKLTRPSAYRVGGNLLEHYNSKTHRCDPSVDCQARELALDRTTIMRATEDLESAGLFRKKRHGGLGGCASYEPVWEEFARLFNKHARGTWPEEECRKVATLTGRKVATQTRVTNPHKETGGQEYEVATEKRSFSERGELSVRQRVLLRQNDIRRQLPSAQVAESKAQARAFAIIRRCNAIEWQAANDPHDTLFNAMVAAEIRKKGSGEEVFRDAFDNARAG